MVSFNSKVNTGLHCVSYRPWCFCHCVHNCLDFGSSKKKRDSEKVFIKKVIKAQNFMRTVFTFLSTLQLFTVKIILAAP